MMREKVSENDYLPHLEELRIRLFYIFSVLSATSLLIYLFHKPFLEYLIKPAEKLIFISPLEVFITRIKVAFFGGFFISLPFTFYHIFVFLLPACNDREKKQLPVIIFMALLFFFAGVIFAFYIVLPVALKFLLNMGSTNIIPMLTFSKYIDFTVKLLLIFGIMSELPFIIFFLVNLKILSIDVLRNKRRHVIVILLILSALLTPPDVFSQLLITIPAYLLFELTLFISSIVLRK